MKGMWSMMVMNGHVLFCAVFFAAATVFAEFPAGCKVVQKTDRYGMMWREGDEREYVAEFNARFVKFLDADGNRLNPVTDWMHYTVKLGARPISFSGGKLLKLIPADLPPDAPGTICGAPKFQPHAEIVWTKTICKQPGRYMGWPTICRRKNGEVIVAFSGDRDAHVSVSGKVQAIRSKDGGETWSEPETWVDGILDDRDAGLLELADGTLLLKWFTSVNFSWCDVPEWTDYFHTLDPKAMKEAFGSFTARSTDGGKTWEKPVRTLGSTPHGAIQLKSGRLLMVSTQHHFGEPKSFEAEHPFHNPVEVSDDGGRTWTEIGCIGENLPRIHGGRLCEPHVVEFPSGKLLAFYRWEEDCCHLLQTESTDGGKTWSTLQVTEIDGFPPHLLLLEDGSALLSYSRRREGHWGEYVRMSKDEGRTWDAIGEVALDRLPSEAHCYGVDFGYPSSVRLEDGTFLTAFYRQDKPGEMPSVMLTKWRLGNRLAEAKALRGELDRELPELVKRGGGDKTRAVVAIMDKFFGWIEIDDAKGFHSRVDRELNELVKIARDEKARLARVACGEEHDVASPRFVTSKVENSRMQTVATRRWPDGRTDRGPVFFTGFGHFDLIQKDLAEMPKFGNNILQMEFGPSWVMPAEGRFNDDPIRHFRAVAERAAKENVQICLLLSPHYFPDWAFARWPEIRDDAGFIRFCVWDPRVRGVLETYLRHVVPQLRNIPALHSICISNEAENYEYGKCKALCREWPKWLERRFGTVAKMNAAWNSVYRSFGEVPVPKNWNGNRPSPELCEFARFDRRMFAEFHEWMAGIIRELAPEIPLHAKIMCQNWQWETPTLVSVDIEDFAALSDLNGNDASYWSLPRPDPKCVWGDAVSEWPLCQIAYDYQRTAAEKPIFNSENHIVRDREKGYVSGDHLYTALWQQALHGQSLTTLWCWERAYDDGKSDFNGLMLERPECLVGWANCALDLNRLADVIAPLQNQEASILLLNSLSSRMWHDGIDPSYECYRALNGLGRQIGVCSERMLEDFAKTGELKHPFNTARAIVMPTPGHLSDAAREGLRKLKAGGIDVIAYAVRPAFDDCGRARDGNEFRFVERTNDGATLMKRFEEFARGWNLPDVPRVLAIDGDHGIDGVESRGYRVNGKSYMSVVNQTPRPVKVRLEKEGRDLVSGRKVGRVLELSVQKPMLIEF